MKWEEIDEERERKRDRGRVRERESKRESKRERNEQYERLTSCTHQDQNESGQMLFEMDSWAVKVQQPLW